MTISYDLSPQVREVSGLPVTKETIVGKARATASNPRATRVL
jgi:hypothetical protein